MSVEVEQRGHLLVMGMRRPQKMNALSRDMYRSLARALYRLEHDPELWVGVIWAVGPHFTSGVDLNDWADAFASGTPFPIGDGEIDPFSLSGPRLSKPLVIAVQGRCYTWDGNCCSTRTCASPPATPASRCSRSAGVSMPVAARHCVFRRRSAGPMHSATCSPATNSAPLGVQGSLRSSRTRMLEGEAAAVAPMFRGMAEVMRSEDAAEGVKSFIERRGAVFRGR